MKLKQALLDFRPLVKMLGGTDRIVDRPDPSRELPYAAVDDSGILIYATHLRDANVLAGEVLAALETAGVPAAVADIGRSVRGFCATVRC